MGASRKIGGLTYNDRLFVKEYIKAKGNGKKAMQVVSPNIKPLSQERLAVKHLNKPEVKNAIIKALDKAGLGEDFIANKLKQNMPDEAIGKGATAATINKTLELLIKLREPVKENVSRSYNYTMFQGMEVLSNQELIDRRTKTKDYFDKIIED